MRHVLVIGLCCLFPLVLHAQQPTAAPQAMDRAAEMKRLAARETELSALQNEVAELREKLGVSEQQVCVSAKIYELSHNALRAQGVDVSKGALASYLSPVVKQSPVVQPKDEPFTRQSIPMSIAPDINDAILKQLETWLADPRKPAKLLAEPTLVTPLGKPAFVNIGGEFPIVVPQSLGTTTIEYRRYGTQLDATATKTEDGNIAMQVRPRVSRLDPSRNVTINGQQVPGLEVRECDIAVTLRPAQTLILSGLVQSRSTAQKQVGRRGAVQPAVTDQIEAVMVITADFVTPETAANTTTNTATAAKPTPAVAR